MKTVASFWLSIVIILTMHIYSDMLLMMGENIARNM